MSDYEAAMEQMVCDEKRMRRKYKRYFRPNESQVAYWLGQAAQHDRRIVNRYPPGIRHDEFERGYNNGEGRTE